MSIPTITSITPSVGPTMGDMLVSIVGTNFVPATLPPVGTFTDGTTPQTVRVLFDGIEATDARCYSATLVTAIPQKHVAGAVDVTLINLDQTTGDPVVGEAVTVVGGFTYAIPIHTVEAQSDLERVVRVLLRMFKDQLLQGRGDVTYAVQTDYDVTTGDELHVTKFAELPGISLVGPDLAENRFYSINEEPTIEDPESPTDFVRTKVPYTVDLEFKIIGASDNKSELLNLISNFVQFMHHNKKLFLDRDASDPSLGAVSYEFDFAPDGQPKVGRIHTTAENASNLRSFDASILIRGFDIEALAGLLGEGKTAGVPNQAVVERGKTGTGVGVLLDPTIQTS